ncbi:tRNA (adenosine(37)-N6)-dimethylallyltransferase MiaA [Cellulomonas sp. PhB143]|uniref:tRNA (adenosine(37)-N6)-dimethylallyltransferase MiaA n=1 Tax=Cellulomonas sp. PhB143 TaxID=2485186 RepID=UPI000F47112A|nr:tRNA (adenosine(37)-N6)-dimethylallyltransferase MiaA [Cellulomonas sp. PhB143]ROS77180.1 tRNA dimethylallyltransferase [Cellulomonas sp. PhB143]
MIVAVVGPTATGKSDLGIELALALGGEVVNADAFQLYRGMDVGTAKVPVPARRGVPHRLLDVLDPAQDASVADYQRDARAQCAELAASGRRAVVVGGSGLYVRALLDRMDFPGTDPRVRAELESRAETEGARVLHAELAAVDPEAAASIGPRNVRRVVRALEVVALTGRPYTANLPRQEYVAPAVQIGLDCDRDALDARVEGRVAAMWDAGLVEEVRGLRDSLGRTASRAVGYAEVLEMLAGRWDEDEARSRVVAGTRRLARKQMGWFGRDPRVHWLDARSEELVADALTLVAAADAGRLVEPRGAHDGGVRRPLGS